MMKFKYNTEIFQQCRLEDLPPGVYNVERFITTYKGSAYCNPIDRIKVFDKSGTKDIFLYEGRDIVWAWPDIRIQGVPKYVTILSVEQV